MTSARDQAMAKQVPGSVTPEQLDQEKTEVNVAIARVKLSEAKAELHKLNLSLCKVTAPISGRIARTYLTPGNLVKGEQTLLAVLINDNPIHVHFSMDERTYFQTLVSMREGKVETRKPPVAIGLASEEDFPHHGLVDAFEPDFKNETSTVRVRAVLDNKDRLLVPGMFVRVRLALSAPRKALLVVDRAIRSEERRKYVYVIDAGEQGPDSRGRDWVIAARRPARDQRRAQARRTALSLAVCPSRSQE